MNYPQEDTLVPLTQLAANLRFTPQKKHFDPESYIPTELIEANMLFTDPEFQRLLNGKFIREAKEFDPDLVRPLYVFIRPNGKYSIADGQHEGVLGILYTYDGGKIKLPCQVRKHPPHFTLQQCLDEEAAFFKKLNFNRTNAGVIQRLRADIALRDGNALIIEEKLNDMGIHIEGIGYSDGVEINGYRKLMEAHKEYGLESVCKSINLYQRHQKDLNAPKWNDIGKPLQGGLIAGLAALYHLLSYLGNGDKNYALNYYLDNNLKKDRPLGKKSLMSDIGGDLQSVLFARRVVERCNGMIQQEVITKRNGKPLQVDIEETIMDKAGLGDPSKL